MTRRTPADYAISDPRERATTFGLATVVTLSVLLSIGGVADRRYEAAYVAQLSASPVQVASATPESARPALLHESV
jgi:hypothetical protein